MRPHRLSLFGVVLTLAACAAGDGETQVGAGAATITLVDTVLIEETPSVFVARPAHLAVSGRDEFFISDAFSRNVIHVRANGQVAGGIGRRGRGPGEFEAPTTMLVAHDSLLLVADQARGGVVVRSLESGLERALLRIEGARPTMTMVGDVVYAGTVNSVRRTALARWNLGGDSVHYFGVLPDAYERSPMRDFIRNVSLAAWGDTLAYIVGLTDVVYIATSDGRLSDSLRVPRLTRRGLPTGQRLAALRDPNKAAAESSLPWALGSLRDGRLVAVFADGEMRSNAFGGRLFVTVLARAGNAHCTDILVPSDGHELPRVAFDGDEMLVLEQRVVRGRAVHVVRRYSFPAACSGPAA